MAIAIWFNPHDEKQDIREDPSTNGKTQTLVSTLGTYMEPKLKIYRRQRIEDELDCLKTYSRRGSDDGRGSCDCSDDSGLCREKESSNLAVS
jgi:hypothetical protein